MQIINENQVEYVRRIDLILTSSQVDDDQDLKNIELCSNEFKNTSDRERLNQQSKNLRIKRLYHKRHQSIIEKYRCRYFLS
jgi:hypothetical protein